MAYEGPYLWNEDDEDREYDDDRDDRDDAEPDADEDAPEWWQEGMPDDWRELYEDDPYGWEYEEFEIGIDYGEDT